MLDYASLIEPIDDTAPCGPDLREDAEFREIEDAPGDFANLKASELAQVVARCDALLQRTKDQAPALVALQAAVRMGDLATANAALELVKGFAETYWDEFHPAPADEMGIARLNELSALARPAAMTLPLQRAAIAKLPAPSMQSFTAAMIAQACEPTAEWSSEDEAALSAQVEAGQTTATQARTVRPNREGARTLRMIMRVLSVDARMADSAAGIDAGDTGLDPSTTRELALDLFAQVSEANAALRTMSDLLYDINALYDSRMGDSASLSPVLSLLRVMIEGGEQFLATFPAEQPLEEGAADVADDGAGGNGASAPRAAGQPQAFVAMTPQSRGDVMLALDAIGRFFAEREPTSPVPMILRRAKAWVEMDFLQLLNEIAPQGLEEAEKLLASPANADADDSY